MKRRTKSPDIPIDNVLNHFDFREEGSIITSRKFARRRFDYSEVHNCVWDPKNKCTLDAHELVMELLQCDSDAAWRYMSVHNLI